MLLQEAEEREKAAQRYVRREYVPGRLSEAERAKRLAEMAAAAEDHEAARGARLQAAAAREQEEGECRSSLFLSREFVHWVDGWRNGGLGCDCRQWGLSSGRGGEELLQAFPLCSNCRILDASAFIEVGKMRWGCAVGWHHCCPAALLPCLVRPLYFLPFAWKRSRQRQGAPLCANFFLAVGALVRIAP